LAGFLFWKKKRAAEVEAPVVEVVAPVELTHETDEVQNHDVVAETAEAAYVDSVTISEPEGITEPTATPEPEPEPEPETEPEPELKSEPEPESELVAVELPKRSAKKGIRSLFSRVKFNPENLDELEDILIQADFGIDASMAIVESVKDRAKNSGATSEQDLKEILAAVIAENLERDDKALNLSDGKLPYVFLVVGVNGVGNHNHWQAG
jgi:fused signal recognition particle receptor